MDRVRSCHTWQPEKYRPFLIGAEIFGHVTHEFAQALAAFPKVFVVTEQQVSLCSSLKSFAERSEKVEEAIQQLVADGTISRWRGEYYPVTNDWGQSPIMKMDRGAAGYFGIRGYGVHVNGLVHTAEGLKIWVGKRSLDKPNAPGKLDHIVAGGQPFGLGVYENLVKEAAEEADIPEALVQKAKPAGIVSYRCAREDGLRNDILFVYDLCLPEDFTPRNTDGEVEEFYLWPLEQVIDRIKSGDDFKFNVSLVLIHFLIRQGYITPDDDPDYCALVKGMQRQSS
ncbi:DUF4743 domain-containing protein [Kiloniella laminariae]|uniref:DUF4743 domain-containing protein n=1 Tax=Kiloniella laminariae TaxID=454162 RepID=A0ABT4LMS4_9PROT|nr:DUF4743 domain-containing protein [Kiloniella laminariae]MCZ4281656.1 DUF4743 domain-containing protein [Kiloniella laminariae]